MDISSAAINVQQEATYTLMDHDYQDAILCSTYGSKRAHTTFVIIHVLPVNICTLTVLASLLVALCSTLGLREHISSVTFHAIATSSYMRTTLAFRHVRLYLTSRLKGDISFVVIHAL